MIIYSLDDVVSAELRDERFHVTGVYMRGGHSTYRLILAEGVVMESTRFEGKGRLLEDMGCSFEAGSDRLLAVDVPPAADTFEVYALLEEGERAGVWGFEEAHCGHPVEGD